MGPEKVLDWLLAEGKALLGASPQPDPSGLTGPFFLSSVAYSTRNLPAEAGGSLARPSGTCHQRVWLPAWAGWAGPLEKLKVELIFPHPPIFASVLVLRALRFYPEEQGASEEVPAHFRGHFSTVWELVS